LRDVTMQSSCPYRFGQGVCFDVKLCGNIQQFRAF
jgi:hypothetical protein